MLELRLCDTWQESPLGRIGDRWGNHIRNDLEGPFPETLSPSDHTLPLQCSNKSRLRASLRGGNPLPPPSFPVEGLPRGGYPCCPSHLSSLSTVATGPQVPLSGAQPRPWLCSGPLHLDQWFSTWGNFVPPISPQGMF